jgi:hypothetical protein
MALSERVRRFAPATLRHATPTTLDAVATVACRSVANVEGPDFGDPIAVLLRGTLWGEMWLIADDTVLIEHADIATSGLPVLHFAEVPHLQRLDADSLRVLGIVKRNFPTARVLQ